MSDNQEISFEDEVSPESVVAKPSPPKSKPEHVEYRVLVDLSYGGRKVRAGKVVRDIPESSIGWLLDGNYIEKVS